VVVVLSILLLSSFVTLTKLPSAGHEAALADNMIKDGSVLDSDFYATKGDNRPSVEYSAPPQLVASSNGCFGLPQSSIDKISRMRIALVKPIFTASAYSTNGFYAFYKKWGAAPPNQNVTRDLNLLNVSISDDWGPSRTLFDFLSSSQSVQCGLVMGHNVQVLNDIDVTKGGLAVAANAHNFDVVILGFSEYVTTQEYSAYRNFVANGGTVTFMDASNFVGMVQYYPSSQHLALVAGHGWRSNGKTAWRSSPYEFSPSANANWVGSNFCCFEAAGSDRGAPMYVPTNTSSPIAVALRTKFGTNVFTFYHFHEENHVTNASDSIIASYPQSGGLRVAAYSHKYKAGGVTHIGITADDIISHDPSAQYFLILSLLYR
jgi:hypothetical protein